MAIKTLRYVTLNASILGLLVLFGSSCGNTGTSESTAKIYGGAATAPGDWLNTVAITRSDLGIFCSGTAVTPKLIVTAAHCAELMENVEDLGVYVGSGFSGGQFMGSYKVTKVTTHPLYHPPLTLNHDVAYLTLATNLNLPASAYVSLPKSAREVTELTKAGKSARLVGFGLRENGDVGQKYQVDVPLSQVGATEMALGGQGKDSCNGDSGGPVFGQLAGGQWRFIGVVSRGGACGTGGIYGRVDANMCWVAKDSGIDLGFPAGLCPSK